MSLVPEVSGATTPGLVRFGTLPRLNALRGLAVCLVLFDHLYSVPVFSRGWFMGGFIGVDVFFVMSGFLISALLIKEFLNNGRISLKAFYIRRALRLFPALLVSFALFVVPIGLISWKQALIDYFYTFTYTAVIPKALEVLRIFPQPYFYPHTWSLSVEEIFYALYPLVFIGICRHKRRFFSPGLVWTLFGLPFATLPLSWYYLEGGAYQSPTWHFGQIYSGVAASMVYANAKWREALERDAPFLLMDRTLVDYVLRVACSARAAGLALGVIFLLLLSSKPNELWMYIIGFPALTAAAALLTLHLSLHKGGLRFPTSMFDSSRLQSLGLISYGAYVYHVPLYRLLEHAASHNPVRRFTVGQDFTFWLAFDVMLVTLTIALSIWSFRSVERHFLELKKRFGA